MIGVRANIHASGYALEGKKGKIMNRFLFGNCPKMFPVWWLPDGLFAGSSAFSDETNSTVRPGGYQFDGKISRPVLENYLSRSITMEGLLNGQGDLKDNIRMLKSLGAKYVGRALCLWGAENDFTQQRVERAREEVPQVLAADPDMILEACVF